MMKQPKLVTLTLRRDGKHGLENILKLAQLARLYLKRREYKVSSFVSCVDLDNHIHCVWDCKYIPQRRLAQVWNKITKDSYVVDIRRVDMNGLEDAVNYISKYITKISSAGSFSMMGKHVIESYSPDGCVKKRAVRMVCKKCGSFFTPLGDADAYGKCVDVEFIEIVELDPG